MKAINIWAVIVSGVASTSLGAFWFMVIFREPYIKGLARTQEQLSQGPNGPTAITMQLFANILMAYILAWLMTQTDYTSVGQAIKLATLVWIGFVACVVGPTYAFQAFPFYFFLINTGYTLVALLISGVVLGAWK